MSKKTDDKDIQDAEQESVKDSQQKLQQEAENEDSHSESLALDSSSDSPLVSSEAESSSPDAEISEDETKEPKVEKSKSASSFSGITVLLVLFVVGALGASGYAHWWQYQNNLQQQSNLQSQTQNLTQQQSQQKSALNAELEKLRQSLNQLQNDLSRQAQGNQQNQKQQQQSLQQFDQQLEAQNQRLLKLSSVNSQNWELAEALYLTRLAGQRLVMENNREAALALLMGADEIIGRQQNPDLFPVRGAITDDITALKVVESLDKESLFLQLSAINRQIQSIPLTERLNFERMALSQNSAAEAIEETGIWNTIVASFHKTMDQLQGYIRKTELQSTIKPLLMPEEQQQIRLSLSLFIESAQLALLRDQAIVFNNALAQAQTQLVNFYPDTNQRKELILALESLQAEKIDQSYPDISGSYRQLNDFIQALSVDQTNVEKTVEQNVEQVEEQSVEEVSP